MDDGSTGGDDGWVDDGSGDDGSVDDGWVDDGWVDDGWVDDGSTDGEVSSMTAAKSYVDENGEVIVDENGDPIKVTSVEDGDYVMHTYEDGRQPRDLLHDRRRRLAVGVWRSGSTRKPASHNATTSHRAATQRGADLCANPAQELVWLCTMFNGKSQSE